jgi:L,D-transpeptidase catalytic domain/Bacterial SH3 domain
MVFTMIPSSEEGVIVTKIVSPFHIIETKEPETKELFHYVEITDSCGPHFEGTCLNVRKEPNKGGEVLTKLRNGVVLKVLEKSDHGGETWYKVTFDDEWLRYPDRVSKDWYVSGNYVQPFLNEGIQELPPQGAAQSSSTKRILIDRSEQKLYAYDGTKLFMEEKISTGLEISPTPRGIFHIYKKTPTRYMQGPIIGISEKYYDLPGVPWNLYFTEQGAIIHGAYWHNNFGKQWSSGCVNMLPEKAKELYMWADLGTEVTVKD